MIDFCERIACEENQNRWPNEEKRREESEQKKIETEQVHFGCCEPN